LPQVTIEKKKTKDLSTLDVQNLIYEGYLETFKLRRGKSFDELLKMANDPRRYSKVRKKNKKT